MRLSLRNLSAAWKFLPNLEKRIYNTKREAIKDFLQVSGANLLWQIGSAILIYEFGFPTPDVIYDLKRMISPDFDVFCKFGDLAEFQLGYENTIRAFKFDESNYIKKGEIQKPPEARFGGIN